MNLTDTKTWIFKEGDKEERRVWKREREQECMFGSIALTFNTITTEFTNAVRLILCSEGSEEGRGGERSK